MINLSNWMHDIRAANPFYSHRSQHTQPGKQSPSASPSPTPRDPSSSGPRYATDEVTPTWAQSTAAASVLAAIAYKYQGEDWETRILYNSGAIANPTQEDVIIFKTDMENLENGKYYNKYSDEIFPNSPVICIYNSRLFTNVERMKISDKFTDEQKKTISTEDL
jgi:hypothetical protein